MGTRRSRHNKGRKPLYKEHRRDYVEPGALEVSTFSPVESAAMILHRGPRYKWSDGGGAYYDQRLAWSKTDTRDLAILCAASADITKCGDVLARQPQTIVNRARDLGFSLPSAWAALIRRNRGSPGIQLRYPFIAKARPEHADLMRANSLVPRGFPEHMRADICQSVMLAMFEGTISLSDVEKNKDKMRWFIRKFYKEQQPWQEVLDTPNDGDNRSYDEKAAHGWAQDGRDEEMADHRRMFNAINKYEPALQIDHVYALEIREARHRSAKNHDHAGITETISLIDSGDYTHGNTALALQVPHAIARAGERYGLTLLPRDLRGAADRCARQSPIGIERDSEAHIVNLNGVDLPVLFNRFICKVMTILPAVELEGLRLVKSGALSWDDHHDEWTFRRTEYRKVNDPHPTGDHQP